MRLIRFIANYLPYLYFMYFIFLMLLLIVSKVIDELLGLSNAIFLSRQLNVILFYPLYLVLALATVQAVVNYHKISKMDDISNDERNQWHRFYRVWLVFANAEYYDRFIHEYNSNTFVRFTRFIKLKPISFDSFK